MIYYSPNIYHEHYSRVSQRSTPPSFRSWGSIGICPEHRALLTQPYCDHPVSYSLLPLLFYILYVSPSLSLHSTPISILYILATRNQKTPLSRYHHTD